KVAVEAWVVRREGANYNFVQPKVSLIHNPGDWAKVAGQQLAGVYDDRDAVQQEKATCQDQSSYSEVENPVGTAGFQKTSKGTLQVKQAASGWEIKDSPIDGKGLFATKA